MGAFSIFSSLLICCGLALVSGWKTPFARMVPSERKTAFVNSAALRMSMDTKPVSTGVDSETYSFVRDDMRPYAMKLHTRDQAPKEGQQKAQTPFTEWTITRRGYLQFLVDSMVVYQTLEDLVREIPELATLQNTGLERTDALRKDIDWMLTMDPELGSAPKPSEIGLKYSQFLKEIAHKSIPGFLCHYYNHYFAHTAGGIGIGKVVAKKVLDGKQLEFYKWEGADVKQLLAQTVEKIDIIAKNWDAGEKQECLEETGACFMYGGSLLGLLKSETN